MAAAQTAILYRTLARWADDSRLREMARVMAREEAASLPHFRAAFEQAAAVQRLAFLSTWRIALVCVRDARDEYLACAFHALQQQWGSAAPFPEIDYLEFVSRMRAVIERCSGLGMPERMLLRSWKKLPRARLAELGGAAFEICRQPARVAA